MFKAGAFALEYVADVFDHRTGLHAYVQLRGAHGIDLRAGKTIVGPPRTGARYEQKVAGALDMWKFAAWRRFARNDASLYLVVHWISRKIKGVWRQWSMGR